MSKKRRRIILIALPSIVILVGGIWLTWEINRVEAGAQLLAQTGQGAIKMLNEYRAGVDQFVVSKDASKILECYADGYLSTQEGQWTEKLKSDRDSVRVYEWEVENPGPLHKNEIATRVERYLQP